MSRSATRSGRFYGIEPFSCSICLEDGTCPTTTLCGHQFHASCLNRWLCRTSTCPFCRTRIGPAQQSFVFSDTYLIVDWVCAETNYGESINSTLQTQFPVYYFDELNCFFDVYVRALRWKSDYDLQSCVQMSPETNILTCTVPLTKNGIDRDHFIILFDWMIEVLNNLEYEFSFTAPTNIVSVLNDFIAWQIIEYELEQNQLQCAATVALYHALQLVCPPLARKDRLMYYACGTAPEEKFTEFSRQLQVMLNNVLQYDYDNSTFWITIEDSDL